jgi:hypothetical protein
MRTSKQKPTNTPALTSITLLEAEIFLRKMGEWHGVVKMERDTIIKWALFLMNKENNKKDK